MKHISRMFVGLQKWDAVMVDWEDSCTFSEDWSNAVEWSFEKGALIHRTVGFLFNETDFSVAVVQSVLLRNIGNEDCRINHGVEIPKSSIRMIKKL